MAGQLDPPLPVLGVDIGASSVKAALVDPHAWRVAERLPSIDIHSRTFPELRSAVERIVGDALALEPALQRVGISTTGSANRQEVVVSSGFYSGYENVRWLDILHACSGGRIDVATVLNDGRAAALGTYLADDRGRGRNLVHFVVGR